MLYAQRALLALAVAMGGAVAVPAAAETAPPAKALYLVQVDGAPLASYEGGVNGLPATKPREGTKIDKRAWSYQAYREHLRVKRAEVLRASGVDKQRTVVEYATA